MKEPHGSLRGLLLTLILACAPLAGCVVYEPYPGYSAGVPDFNAAFQAAAGAAQDAGVAISSANSDTGEIRGNRDDIDVVITVVRRNDGSVRVQFDAKPAAPGLGDRFSRAYDRRMGR